jgi:dihydroorotase-like cyclic amidohydrolase
MMELRGEYGEWDIRDCGEAYISPGVVDCNVVENSQWESRGELTKAAISGGVTMLLLQPSLYDQPTGSDSPYCDIGHIQSISSLQQFHPSASFFAYKIYLYPPSAHLPAYTEPLEDLFDHIIQTPLPLFVDASMPNTRTLYTSSPYHLASLQERLEAEYVDESRFAAGAYEDEDAIVSSGADSEDELSRPDRSQSTMEEISHRGSIRCDMLHTTLPRPRGHTEDLENIDQLPTIISDLSNRIDHLLESQQDLSVSEEKTYDNAGKYEYSENSPEHKGSSASSDSPSVVKYATSRASLLKKLKMRPKPLVVDSKKGQESEGNSYAFHLAYLPDQWEVKGVGKVLKALRRAPCRVHFCNISSAAAVNKVLQFKQTGLSDSATVETCPHYLFFATDDIPDGETRLKTFPPIRNRSNCNLLWELLKVKALDIISSHHISVAPELKFLDSGVFKKALNGINGLGYGLQAVWTKLRMPAVHSASVREHYIVRLAKWMSHNPARLIGISHLRGSIEKGKLADLIVWYPHEEFAAPQESPYRGKQLYGRVKEVYVRGKKAYDEGVALAVGRVVARTDFL